MRPFKTSGQATRSLLCCLLAEVRALIKPPVVDDLKKFDWEIVSLQVPADRPPEATDVVSGIGTARLDRLGATTAGSTITPTTSGLIGKSARETMRPVSLQTTGVGHLGPAVLT